MSQRPTEPIVLYQFEGCPMCRRVRLAIIELDLPTEIRSCPRGGTRFRPEAKELAGKRQFPFLVDPNTGESMLESVDIVNYLYATYSTEQPPDHILGPKFHFQSLLSRFQSDPDYAERKALCTAEAAYLWEPGASRRTVLDSVRPPAVTAPAQ